MYCLNVSKIANSKLLIILEGKLINPEILTNDLEEIIQLHGDNANELNFDMKSVVMINEACYNILSKFENSHKIKIINSSMFIEEQIMEILKSKKSSGVISK